MQVLVVDDEQGIRDVVRRALEREAFEVLEAVDGQGAIAIADRFELALVILDLELPEMSGLDLLVALRRSEEHTSELQSLMRISYAVFCLKKKNTQSNTEKKHIKSPAHKATQHYPRR